MKKDKRFKYQVGDVFRWRDGDEELMYIREVVPGDSHPYLLCSLSSNYVYDRVSLATLEYAFKLIDNEWVRRKSQNKLKEDENDPLFKHFWYP